MGEFEHNSYKSVINESVGRSALTVVPAPFMDLSNELDEFIEQDRLNKNFKTSKPVLKDEFTGRKLDGFRTVGPKYFKLAEEDDDLSTEKVVSFEKEPDPNVKIIFADGSAHIVTCEEAENAHSLPKRKKIIKMKSILSIIEPEDLGFSPTKIKKTPRDNEASIERFWRRIGWQINRRHARLNKQKILNKVANNYFDQIINSGNSEFAY